MRMIAGLFVATFFAVGVASADLVVNEFVNNHIGTDTNEYVEVFGLPNTDYSDYTIVEIEGDGTSAGLIDDMTFTIGVTDANGIWWSGYQPNVPENGSMTYLLVTGYTGGVGLDIDTDDNGVIDTTYWTSIVDSVGVYDGGTADWTYGEVQLDSNLPPAGYTPGGASRIPNGTDTNSLSDWMRNDFDGAGIPGFSGTVDPGECLNTPGLINVIPEPASLGLLALGGLALLRRR